MRFRILIVLFIVSLTLLPGGNADATTITHNFLFRIDRILINGDEYTGQYSEEEFEDEFEWIEDEFEWAKGDAFHLSFSYEDDAATSNAINQIIAYYPTLSLGLNRVEFGLEPISGYVNNPSYQKPRPLYTGSTTYLENVTIKDYSSAGKNFFCIENVLGSNNWGGYYQFTEPTGKIDNNIIIEFSAPVPEPSTLILLGSGLVGLIIYRKKRQA